MFWFSENLWEEGGEVRHKKSRFGALCLLASRFSRLLTAFVLSSLIPRKPQLGETWNPKSILYPHTPTCFRGEVHAPPTVTGLEVDIPGGSLGSLALRPALCQPEQGARSVSISGFLTFAILHFYLSPLLGSKLGFSTWWLLRKPPSETVCDSYAVFLAPLESPGLKWANAVLSLRKHLTSRCLNRVKLEGQAECHFDEIIVKALLSAFLTQSVSDVPVPGSGTPPPSAALGFWVTSPSPSKSLPWFSANLRHSKNNQTLQFQIHWFRVFFDNSTKALNILVSRTGKKTS